MVAKKKILNIIPFDDIHLIGINTVLNDYLLAWHLNQKFNFNLTKCANLTLSDKPYAYSFFYFDEGENLNVYNLVQNQVEGVRLAQLTVPTDYLLIIRNGIVPHRLEYILEVIRGLDDVNQAYLIDIAQNKLIDPVLEQIDFHEFKIIKAQTNLNKPSRKPS